MDEWKSHNKFAMKFLELGVTTHHKRCNSLIISLHTDNVHLRYTQQLLHCNYYTVYSVHV